MGRTNQQRGALAKALGRAWEKRIEAHIEIAKANRIVGFSQHAQPEMGYRKPKVEGEEGKVFHKAAGFADYSGHLIGGLSFALEAKSKMVDSFYRSDISDSQIAHLDSVQRDGGLSLFALQLVDYSGYRHAFVERWDRVPWRKKKSAESIDVQAFEGSEMVGDCLFEPFVRACPLCRSMRLVATVQVMCAACWHHGSRSVAEENP